MGRVQARHRPPPARQRGPLIGKVRPIKGEQYGWIYDFPWTGTTADGKILRLAARQPVELVSYDKARRVFVFKLPDGRLLSVAHPPNTYFHNLLMIRAVPLVGASREVLVNRLGEPSVKRTKGDFEIWEYRNATTQSRTNADQSFSTTTGMIGRRSVSEDTTTTTPYTETRTFSPYDFKLKIGKDGRVISMKDVCPPPGPWVRS